MTLTRNQPLSFFFSFFLFFRRLIFKGRSGSTRMSFQRQLWIRTTVRGRFRNSPVSFETNRRLFPTRAGKSNLSSRPVASDLLKRNLGFSGRTKKRRWRRELEFVEVATPLKYRKQLEQLFDSRK